MVHLHHDDLLHELIERTTALEARVGSMDEDLRRELADVDNRATAAGRFVRRVLYAAGGLVTGSIVAAVVLIYQSGERAATSRAEIREARQDVNHKLESLESSLTDIRSQVKLLLENQLRSQKP